MRMFSTLLLAVWLAHSRLAADHLTSKNWQVFYSPRGGCTEAVVEALGRARSTVLVQAYSFTSAPIAKVLVDASRRGVKIEVLLDKSQRTEKYSSATFLHNQGVPTYIDAQPMDVHRHQRTANPASTLLPGVHHHPKPISV